MKLTIKNLITSLVILLILEAPAMSSCKDIYQKVVRNRAAKAVLSTTATGVEAYVGFWGTQYAIISIADGEFWGGILTTVGVNTPPLFAAFSSIQQALEFRSLNKVRLLINESELMFGKILTETAETLSEQLSKVITEEEVSEIILAAHESQQLCLNEKHPYDYETTLKYLKFKIQ